MTSRSSSSFPSPPRCFTLGVLLAGSFVLGVAPTQAEEPAHPRRDALGDPLPQGAILRIGTTRLRHGEGKLELYRLGFSPDGKFLLAGEFDDVGFWDAATGRETRRLQSDVTYPHFAFSADGTRLALQTNGTIEIYDPAHGKKLLVIDTVPDPVPFAFSPDGKSLIAFIGQGVREGVTRWDTATGKEIGHWRNEKNKLLALSVDARLIAAMRDENDIFYLLDAASGKKLREWKTTGEVLWAPSCVLFSPDGRFLIAACKDGRLRVYETDGGKEVRSWKVRDVKEGSVDSPLRPLHSLAFAADGSVLASVDGAGVLRLWDWKTGRELRHFEGVRGYAALSPDGKIVAASGADGRIRMWDVATGRDHCSLGLEPGKVVEAVFSPDARLLAVTFENEAVRLFDAVGGRSLQRFPECQFVAFSPDGGRSIVRDRDGSLRVLDTAGGEERVRLRGTKGDRFGAWTADGKVVVTLGVPEKLPIRIWDAATGKELRQLQGIKELEEAGCSSNAGTIAVRDARAAGSIRLFAADTGKELPRLKRCRRYVDYEANRVEENGEVTTLSMVGLPPLFSPDGKIVLAGCDEGSFGLWDVDSGKRFLHLDGGLLPVRPSFSPDGASLVLLDGRGDPCLVDAATGQVRRRLTWKSGKLGWILQSFSHTLSADGRLLAAAYDDHTLVLWETATGQAIRTWPGHGKGRVRGMGFAPDGRRLATIGTDGTALVWDVTGRSPDGRLAARPLTAEQTEQAWRDLADADAAKAHQAVWSLIAAPADALALLRRRLKPAESVDGPRLERLIADLDAETFAVREKATEELRKTGELAEPALRKALTSRPSLERRRRLQELLDAASSRRPSGEVLRQSRAVEVLERIGTPEARQILNKLAGGAAGARPTREAKKALDRLALRGPPGR